MGIYFSVSHSMEPSVFYHFWRQTVDSRNEEAVNSTRSTIYSLKVFYYLLYRRRYFLFVSELIDLVRVLATTGNNVSDRRLYACINTRKFKGLDFRKITSLPEIKKSFTWHVISLIAKNKPHAFPYIQPHFHTIKVQHTTISVLLIKILMFFDHSVVFTCSKVITLSRDKIRERTRFGKSSKFNLS